MTENISVGLADLDQDIAGSVPVDLIQKWSSSNQTPQKHSRLLDPYREKGTVVASDCEGLSILAKTAPLLTVLRLISDTKTVIHDIGVETGGSAVGEAWPADNTEFIYPQSVEPTTVFDAMVETQRQNNRGQVKVGLGITVGSFLNIGGGLFGKDADLVEELAENHAAGGEIAVTHAAYKRLTPGQQSLMKPKRVKELPAKLYSAHIDEKAAEARVLTHPKYPLPFPDDFFEALHASDTESISQTLLDQYLQDNIVVLVRILHEAKPLLLDRLSGWALANVILKRISMRTEMEEIKSNGSLGIFVTKDKFQALEFAKGVKQTLTGNGYMSNVGVAKGKVLRFTMHNGRKDIAGDPVNVSSKLAEDCGVSNRIMLDKSFRIARKHLPQDFEKYNFRVSRVELQGVMI